MVGERLTELRIKNNMTQEEFAEYMGVTRQSVSKWETDKTYPDVEKLITIAELYNVTLDYLIRGQEAFVEEDTAEEGIAKSTEDGFDLPKRKKTGILICLIISVIFALAALAMVIMFLIQNPWFHSDIHEQAARVDKVYAQLSMAEVSYKDEAGQTITELVLLDTANAGEGDYIDIYTNDNSSIYVEYGFGILFVVVIFLVLNVGAIFILTKELAKL